jgi:hypothetical protein
MSEHRIPRASILALKADTLAAMSPGTVTQATSNSTAVTCHAFSGLITTSAATLAAASSVAFTVNNNKVTSTSRVYVSIDNFAGTYGTNGFPTVAVGTIANNSFVININNVHASNALGTNALKIAFLVVN